MSIIYEALKKVEGQKETAAPEIIPQSKAFPVERAKRKVKKDKKKYFLPAGLLLVALGLSALPFILPQYQQKQIQVREQEVVVPALVVEKKEIDPARIYRAPELRSQASEEVVLRNEPTREYILEGIVYDPKDPFALINGRVMNESEAIGNFQIERIWEDRVDMINIKNNSKVTLSLP